MANLVETAINAGKFETLIKALQAAELTDILTTSDTYTVFAPTDEAFAKLPEGTIESLLQDIPKLKQILTYHVAFGDVRSDDLAQIDEVPTFEGSVLAVESQSGRVKLNDANVVQKDILADNGVIHAINSVLMPAIIAGH
ncbi:fasciclin domain-containing protein [Rivularia sp. UHCC 0363]|uniref:fasciclin domain-containing protein n=1 Tax=Rivularia sp. UHCC 0363 TaxID=3110244 RepID=UPI002B1F15E0|nr:fasciclin domain-containing protein [Rivularia sp. UHCC 0363]MEA5598106.1 fasciclin domain-containing protein [Rivularia sp. UHCC 0363]